MEDKTAMAMLLVIYGFLKLIINKKDFDGPIALLLCKVARLMQGSITPWIDYKNFWS